MKFVSKILFFVFIGTLVVALGCYIGFDAAHLLTRIGNDLNALHNGYVSFFTDYDNATVYTVYSAFTLMILVLIVLISIQIRRKKTLKFSIYTLIVVFMSLSLVFAGKRVFNLRDGFEKVLSYILYFLLMAEALACAVCSVPQTFESSELKANSKKKDSAKWIDLGIALGLIVAYFVLLAFISGGKFGNIFKHFFTYTLAAKGGVGPIILVVVELFGIGFLLYKLIKQRKSVLGPLFLLFVEFVAYTYSYYGRVIDYNSMVYFQSHEIGKILLILCIEIYFFAVIIYGMFTTSDTVITLCENKRQKLYNHREKYVYGDRRRFGDSIVKEWENSKNQGMATFGSQTVTDEEVVFDDIDTQTTGIIEDTTGVQGSAELIAEQGVEEEVSALEMKADDTDDKGRSVVPFETASEEAALDFRVKLLSLEPEKQARYNKIRNKLQSYKKIKQRFSKTVDSYRYAGELVAKISVLGSTLRLHLALDPDSYDVEKYHQVDLSSKSKYVFVPFTLIQPTTSLLIFFKLSKLISIIFIFI